MQGDARAQYARLLLLYYSFRSAWPWYSLPADRMVADYYAMYKLLTRGTGVSWWQADDGVCAHVRPQHSIEAMKNCIPPDQTQTWL